MKEETLIHVKLEYGEAVESKKSILASEMNLLKILRSMKNYQTLRQEELKTKEEFYKRLKKISEGIKKIQGFLPKPKIPEILKKEDEIKKYKSRTPKEKEDNSIENQLKEIQERLKSISS